MQLRIGLVRASLSLVALGELVWSFAYYFRPDLALGAIDRTVLDPVMARQYPLYLTSVALAYALAAIDPVRYRRILWVCIVQRAVELGAAAFDWHARALSGPAFARVAVLEIAIGIVLVIAVRALGPDTSGAEPRESRDPRDVGLTRMLRGFGGLEIFWFFASTIFVQVGSRLLAWKLQDPYTTQQQGVALLIIGLVSLVAASQLERYRILVWVPVASQLIGIVNSFNEIHLGSIGWGVAATQWTIESSIVAAFAYFSRHRLRGAFARPMPPIGAPARVADRPRRYL